MRWTTKSKKFIRKSIKFIDKWSDNNMIRAPRRVRAQHQRHKEWQDLWKGYWGHMTEVGSFLILICYERQFIVVKYFTSLTRVSDLLSRDRTGMETRECDIWIAPGFSRREIPIPQKLLTGAIQAMAMFQQDCCSLVCVRRKGLL